MDPLNEQPDAEARPQPPAAPLVDLPSASDAGLDPAPRGREPVLECDVVELSNDPLEVPFQRLAPGFVGAERVSNGIATTVIAALAVGLAIAGFVRGDLRQGPWPWLVGGGALLVLLVALHGWFWPPKVLRHTRYRLGPRALEIRRGIVVRRWIAVPRSRIQHTDVSSGPIQRRFGIATLTVNTAGTTNASIALGGLPEASANALRDELMAGLERAEDDGV